MRVIIQRVLKASVEVNQKIVSSIDSGLLVLVGFEQDEEIEDLAWVSKKIISLRVFQDQKDKMNLSLSDIEGEILVVSQFSLHSLVKKGNRPSFVKACNYLEAQDLYNRLIKVIKQSFKGNVREGVFGADMKISSVNNGPLTFFIDTKNKE